jgi:hypothetical protein
MVFLYTILSLSLTDKIANTPFVIPMQLSKTIISINSKQKLDYIYQNALIKDLIRMQLHKSKNNQLHLTSVNHLLEND